MNNEEGMLKELTSKDNGTGENEEFFIRPNRGSLLSMGFLHLLSLSTWADPHAP
jgi:hypothetical protein